ncbi:MAG TPA: hypothetical protein VGE43_19390 [Acidimicrobiales bacterium]
MLPLPTTTVTFWTLTEAEPGEGRSAAVLSGSVPAHIGRPTGTETMAPGGGSSTVDAVCWSTVVEGVTAGDQVENDTTGEVWEIVAVFTQRGLGLDHTRCELRATTGRAA